MANILYESDNHAVIAAKGGGRILLDKITGEEVFAQPGDDAAVVDGMIASLDDVAVKRRSRIFDIAMAEYF